MGFGAGDGNLVRYVDNRPLVDTDPSGKAPKKPEVNNPLRKHDPKRKLPRGDKICRPTIAGQKITVICTPIEKDKPDGAHMPDALPGAWDLSNIKLFGFDLCRDCNQGDQGECQACCDEMERIAKGIFEGLTSPPKNISLKAAKDLCLLQECQGL